jgi:CRP-like cAMP-binding protein
MLRQLSIHSRSAGELRQLAVERREQAATKTGSIRALLLKEAQLLEFQVELRNWADRANIETRADGRRDFRPASLPSVPYELAPLVAKMSSRLGLAATDQQAFLAAASLPRFVQKGQSLIEQGEDVAELVVLCSGMTQTVRTLSDGRQQIVAVSVAGDMLNAGGLLFQQAHNSTLALTPAICLSMPFRLVEALTKTRPAIARALWLETAAQAAIQQEWMVWLGRRAAQTRLAHFLCEISYRLQPTRSGPRDEFEFPLTQRDLADLLGLSSVHVNRTLQVLRSQGIIELSHQRLTVRNRAGLYEMAEFDPRYLDGLRPFAPRET